MYITEYFRRNFPILLIMLLVKPTKVYFHYFTVSGPRKGSLLKTGCHILINAVAADLIDVHHCSTAL